MAETYCDLTCACGEESVAIQESASLGKMLTVRVV